MPRSIGPVEWMMAAGGVGLVIAAVSNRQPLGVIRETFGGPPAKPIDPGRIKTSTDLPPDGAPAPAPGGKIPYDAPYSLVFVRPGGATEPIGPYRGVKLDRPAAVAFHEWERLFGQAIPLTGGWRSHDEQCENYRRDPGRFAPCGTSWHEKGRAADVNTNLYVNRGGVWERLKSTAEAAGWCWSDHRESWHFSYGGCG